MKRRLPTLMLAFASALAACRSTPPQQVVFVCEHGAAKSVVAAAYFNKLAAERGLSARAIARGATPQAKLADSAVAGLAADGLSANLSAPRALSVEDIRTSALLITFDCDQAAMKGLLGMGACWSDVPATREDYLRARDAIRAHLEVVLDQMARR